MSLERVIRGMRKEIDELYARIAGKGAGGGAPGTPGYNPAWFAATQIYVDPLNGSDAAAGTSSGAPLKTWAEVVRRYGSNQPTFNYGQSCAYFFLNSQTAGTDPIFFEPRVSGGGQALLEAVPAQVGPSFVGGAVTAKARGAPGTLLQVAGMPAGTVKNMYLVNTTRSSAAIIDSMAVLVATMQQPQTGASLFSTAVVPAPVEDDTWTTGDSYQIYNLLSLNLKLWRPVGGDETAAAQPCGGWVFTASIADPSGTGASVYFHGNRSACNVLVNCVVPGRLHCLPEGGRGFGGLYALGCSVVGGALFSGGGGCDFAGGGFTNGIVVTGGALSFTNDCILHGTITGDLGFIQLANVFSDGTFSLFGTLCDATGFVWGSYAVTLDPGARWWNQTGSTFVLKALLTSGALKFGTATAGATYTAATGLWSAGNVALTPAAIDAAPGAAIVNPLTGAGFSAGQ